MNYDYSVGTSMTKMEQISEAIDICNKLDGDEKATIFDFGRNGDLVLHIYKDDEYNREVDKDLYNLVTIHTAQDGEWVDDTDDTYVTDGTLHKELERIYEYRDFGTL